jgi:hypothetical protein
MVTVMIEYAKYVPRWLSILTNIALFSEHRRGMEGDSLTGEKKEGYTLSLFYTRPRYVLGVGVHAHLDDHKSNRGSYVYHSTANSGAL